MNSRAKEATHILRARCLEAETSMEESASKLVSASHDTLNVADLASMLRIHPVTVRLKAASGEIPGRQIGNRWRFSRARIEAWLSQEV